ncbi:DUF4192 family protein, partial [Leucobacter chromiireducens]|uniref:DUF4192 family protein n=1 Tax=Leucobacter chromiireducens TaxID=283877 RepID=UPI0019D1476D
AQPPHVSTCRTPADFLALLPHLLGFEPRNSLAVVRFVGTRSRELLRIDLPQEDGAEQAADALSTVCAALDSLAAAPPVDLPVAVGLAIVTDVPFAGAGPPWRRLAEALRVGLPRAGYGVRELCCRAPDGWASSLDDRAPRGGRPLSELSLAPIALSAAVHTGALPEQRHLGAIPAPEPARARAVARALDSPPEHASPLRQPPLGDPEWLARADAHARGLRSAAPLSAAHIARLITELRDHRVWCVTALSLFGRHRLAAAVAPGSRAAHEFAALPIDRGPRGGWSVHRLLAHASPAFTDAERLPLVRERLSESLAVCPPPLRASLYALSAWTWWLTGLQSVAERQLDAAYRAEPANPLVPMLRELTAVPSHLVRAAALLHAPPQRSSPRPAAR